MKLECGMYVRFDYHRITVPIQIGKITKVYYEEPENSYHYLTDMGLVIGEDNLVKEPSHNIIEVIEVGDFLKIEFFSPTYEKRVKRLFEVTYKDERIINLNNAKYGFLLFDNDFHKDDIKEFEPIVKSIITKEQFESIEYKVGE